jgi:NADH:ubiquinone oxidoreductase subunit F (NADH-binding)
VHATVGAPGTGVAVFGSVAPRLLRPELTGRESLADYRAAGGYAAGAEGPALIDELEAAGLRGRGGAAFPAAVKWRAVAGQPGPRAVLVNGDEGEPVSRKDRHLLRDRPHLVLDGTLRAAAAVGAEEAVVYVADDVAAGSVAEAIREHAERFGADVAVRVVRASGAYVAGEETAALRAVEGEDAKPRPKPPWPFEAGLHGRPTLVQNVETLANVPWIATAGAAAYRELGTAGSPGTFLLTAGGACGRPGVAEVPFGVTVGEALDAVAGGTGGPPLGFLMGGYFGGILNARGADLVLDYDALRAEGSGLGCGAITVLAPDACALGVVAEVTAFFARESAQQCGACINGTVSMRDALLRLRDGAGGPDDVERLERWAVGLRGRGGCALLDGAAGLVGSLLREFPEEVAAHAGGRCTSDTEAGQT